MLAPICDTLDTISLFSQGQHLAFLLTCAAAYATWRVMRRRRTTSVHLRRPEMESASKALLVLLGVYASGAMLPRPTAKLTMLSPDEVVVDFHSHTRYSWDGRSSFSPEESRRWHHASGFDVAYITDHSTFAGAQEAARLNPIHAGDGTVMLSGIEVRDRGNHLVVLGTDAHDRQSYSAGDLHELIFQREVEARGSRPVVLFTLPGNLKSESAMSVDGIEVSDAAPRGLSESDAQRGTILELAQAQNQAIVASSNNHGWASASPAWSVMRIHNWRAMTPAQLDTAIRRQILGDGWSAVRVIDRRAPGPVSLSGLAVTVPAAAWQMITSISWAERVSWLCWIWASFLLISTMRRSRIAQPSEDKVRNWGKPQWHRTASSA
ncbi:MAG TPA: hypothetical protein VJ840_09945 [Gemmatimonadaceae bacterium]|nr:hypothetical protein [Gemmatimonadaceae bacterium]